MHVITLPPAHAGQALRGIPIAALRRLHVEETEDEVVITGSVGSYYLKQLAQEAVLPVLGERALRNRVVVDRGRN